MGMRGKPCSRSHLLERMRLLCAIERLKNKLVETKRNRDGQQGEAGVRYDGNNAKNRQRGQYKHEKTKYECRFLDVSPVDQVDDCKKMWKYYTT